MKKVLIFGALLLTLFMISTICASEINQNNNSTKGKTYANCLKTCLTEKNNAQSLCTSINKNQTRSCVLERVTCDTNLRIDSLKKIINVSELIKRKKECSSTYLNCTKTLNLQRKICFDNVRNITCDKKCKEEVCESFNEPVCGVDAKTYLNDCQIKKAGVTKSCEGSCPCLVCKNYYWFDNETTDCNSKKFCGAFMSQGLNVFNTKAECVRALNISDSCQTNENCKTNEFCKKENCTSENGKCTKMPQTCTAAYNPICGCDGKTYSNECTMKINKVNKRSSGVCMKCNTDLDCPQIMCFKAPCPGFKCTEGQCKSTSLK